MHDVSSGHMATIDELPLSALQRIHDDVGNLSPIEVRSLLEWATDKHEGFIPRKYLDKNNG